MFILLKKKNIKYIVAFAIISILSMMLLNYYSIDQLPWRVNVATLGTLFMLFGYSLKKYDVLRKINTIKAIVILTIGVCAMTFNVQLDLNNRIVGNYLLMIMESFSLSLFTMYVFSNININSKLLSLFGRNTILVLAFNRLINKYSSLVWKNIPIINMYNYNWFILFIVDIIVSSFIIIVFNMISNKYHYVKVLIGNRS